MVKRILRKVKEVACMIRYRLLQGLAGMPVTPETLRMMREFSREQAAVQAGIERYQSTRGANSSTLRRNIHRLEKGMVMQPFRFPFGLDYIAETVTAYSEILSTSSSGPLLQWAHDVLQKYFDFTTTDPFVAKWKQVFIAIPPPKSAVPLLHESSKVPFPVQLNHSSEVDYYFGEAVAARSSVRHFEDRKVPTEVVLNALDHARRAPSACNRQPFRYHLFMNREAAQMAAALALGTQGYVNTIQHLAMVVGDLSCFESPRDRHVPYIDASLSAMIFILSLQAKNIATCCINWPDVEGQETAMTQLLQLPPYERPVMLIAFGYSLPGALVPRSEKKSVSEISQLVQ